MRKITYINSHKRRKRFAYEIFGFLYSFLVLGILIYYVSRENFINLMANDLFIVDFNPLLKPFYFSLIFVSLLLLIFSIGVIRIIKTRISYFLYPVLIVSSILLFLSGFSYGKSYTSGLFDAYIIAYAVYFIVLYICFIFERRDMSKYGSVFMRIIDITCGSFFILLALQISTKIFKELVSGYKGYIQMAIILISGIYILANSIYVFLKYETRYNIR